jgi:hypothetical protein
MAAGKGQGVRVGVADKALKHYPHFVVLLTQFAPLCQGPQPRREELPAKTAQKRLQHQPRVAGVRGVFLADPPLAPPAIGPASSLPVQVDLNGEFPDQGDAK